MDQTIPFLSSWFPYRPVCQILNVSAVDVCVEVKSISIDVSKEEVLVESALSSAEVQALIESTGRRAVLKGIGESEQCKVNTRTCSKHLHLFE